MVQDTPATSDSRQFEGINVEGSRVVFGDKHNQKVIDLSTHNIYYTPTPITRSFTADQKGQALLVAAEQGDVQSVKELLEEGANFKYTNKDNQTALFKAVALGRAAVVDVLLESYDRQVFLCNEPERQWADTPLHKAAFCGRITMVEKLLAHGAQLENEQRDNCTPLHLAAIQGHEPIVRLLLDHGANHKAENIHGSTPLHCASRNGNLQVIKALLDHDTTVRYMETTNVWSDTALFLCVLHGHEDAARELIARGANVHVKNNDRNTLLHAVCSRPMPDLLAFMLPMFAPDEFYARNKWDQTPMDIAQAGNKQRCIALLRERMK